MAKYFDREVILLIVATLLLILGYINPSEWIVVSGLCLGKMETKRYLDKKKKNK